MTKVIAAACGLILLASAALAITIISRKAPIRIGCMRIPVRPHSGGLKLTCRWLHSTPERTASILPVVLAAGEPANSTRLGTPQAYPRYSAYFKKPSPFHATVAYLTALPGTVRLPTSTVANYWSQGWYTLVPAENTPMFFAAPHKHSYVFSCLLYAKPNPCDANGRTVWFNTSDVFTEDNADHHIVSVDPISGYEIDGWGGNASYPCNIIGGTLNCSWGGLYSYNSGGLATAAGNSGVHAGFAIGAFILGAQDMLDGLNGIPIKHALGVRARCLDEPTVYPADTALTTDASCTEMSDAGPRGAQPAYGDLLVLDMSSAQIAATAYSSGCKVILNALATYGAYLMDTGSGNNAIFVENPQVYGSADNPWYGKIEPAFQGDGNDSPGVDFSFESCMNRLAAQNFKMYQIQRGAGQ